MFEGKNIHFSPLDNKPLCSYSSKLCRQRRLNSYAFCIRHILEDKSAPFKQCGFVTRNNSQKCLNAIPSNQERGFCHSHMQKIVSKPDITNTTIFSSGGNGTTLNNDNNNKSSSVLLSSSSPLIKNCLNFHSSIVRDNFQNTKQTVLNGDSFIIQDKISNNLHKSYESSLSSSTSSLSSSSSSIISNNSIIVSSSNPTTSSTSTTIYATCTTSSGNTATTNTIGNGNSSNGTNSQTTTFQKGKVTTFPSSFTISSANIINNSGFKVICEKPVNNYISSSGIHNNKTINNVNKSVNLQNPLSTIAPIKSTKIESETAERYNRNCNSNNNNNNNSGITKKVRNNIIVTTYPDNNNKQQQQQLTIGNQSNLKKKPQYYNKSASVNNNIIINNNNNNNNKNKNIQFGAPDNKLTNPIIINATNNISAQQSNNNNNCSTVATLLCVRDRWKKFKFNPKIGDEDIKPAVHLEHMKTIKILEKLPLFAESGNKSDDKCHVKLENTGNKLGKRSSFATLPISSGIEILLVPPFLSKSKLHSNNNNNTTTSNNKTTKSEIKHEHAFTVTNGIGKGQTENGVESSSSNDPLHNYFKSYAKIKIEDGNEDENDKKISQSNEDSLQPWEWETRKEFLARVRRAFKRQYKTITKASKLSEKQDKSDKAFREALITCALNDSSRCAQILVSDPKFEETATMTMTGKRGGGVQVEIKKENEIQFGNSISINNIKNNNPINSTTMGITTATTTTTTSNSGKSSFSQNPNDKSRIKKLLNGKISPADGKTNSVRLNNGFDNDSICDPQIVNTKTGINNNNKLNNLASGNYLWPNGCNSNSSSSSSSCSSSAENLPDSSKNIKANKKLSNGNRNLNGNNQFSIKSYANPNQTLNGINNCSFVKTSKNTLNSGNNVPSPKKKAKKASTSPTSLKSSFKKRKVDSGNNELVSHLDFNNQQSSNGQQQQLDSMVLESSHHDDNLLRNSLNSHEQLLSVPSSSSSSSVDHLQSVSNLETVLGSVSSSEAATTDASFDSPFDHSTSSQPDVGEFSDDDLENSFELQLDPEITHQASRLLEDNGLTEDDFNDLFPETRMGDHKLNGDLGIDFTSNFDTTDIHYDSLFANFFPSLRTNLLGQPESISVNNQF